ncbi:MAG: ribose 5-phosphate isomerase [Chloroflexi bacterium]|nr:ribose 5-phosphate isomerase [Chloroflexota bacterium]
MTDESRDKAAAMKRRAARQAASLVQDGMIVGLGTGSTARLFVEALAERVDQGLHILAVATSEATATQASASGIPLTTLDTYPKLDLVVDGADEVDPELNLIKGLGGALLREKIVASATDLLVIMVDESKLVARLGEHVPVPVEVEQFGWTLTAETLRTLGAVPVRRTIAAEDPFVTDGGHFILDCRFEPVVDLRQIGPLIKAITGVVEHGLFLRMASTVMVGTPDGLGTMRRATEP